MNTTQAPHIRPARRADLPFVTDIERATFADATYPDFFFRQAFDLWGEWFFVATDDEENRHGYAIGAPALASGDAWLLSLAVRESVRGKGTGRALAERMLEAMQAKGVRAVRLTVHPQNAARALYRTLGFREVESDAAYFHAGDPRIVMSRML